MNAIFGRCRILCNVCVCSVGSRVNQAKWDNMTYNCWVSNSFSLTLLEKIRVSYPILSVPFRRRIKVPPTYCSRDITPPIQYNPSVFSLLLLVSSGVFYFASSWKIFHGKMSRKMYMNCSFLFDPLVNIFDATSCVKSWPLFRLLNKASVFFWTHHANIMSFKIYELRSISMQQYQKNGEKGTTGLSGLHYKTTLLY